MRVRGTFLTDTAPEMDRLLFARFAACRFMYAAFVLVVLAVPGSAAAKPEAARALTKQDHALVRSLEALYAKSMDTARSGDLDAYWRWRTAAARERC